MSRVFGETEVSPLRRAARALSRSRAFRRASDLSFFRAEFISARKHFSRHELCLTLRLQARDRKDRSGPI